MPLSPADPSAPRLPFGDAARHDIGRDLGPEIPITFDRNAHRDDHRATDRGRKPDCPADRGRPKQTCDVGRDETDKGDGPATGATPATRQHCADEKRGFQKASRSPIPAAACSLSASMGQHTLTGERTDEPGRNPRDPYRRDGSTSVPEDQPDSQNSSDVDCGPISSTM